MICTLSGQQATAFNAASAIRVRDILNRVGAAGRWWSSFAANNDLPAGYLPSDGIDLVSLYLTYQAMKGITLTASVENLLNEYYVPMQYRDHQRMELRRTCRFQQSGSEDRHEAGLKIHFGGA